MAWAAGVDIGGTKIEIAAVDLEGKIHERILSCTNAKQGPQGILNEIFTGIQKLQQTLQSKCAAIGIGMAGQIDALTGLVAFAPNLDWHDFPLKEKIQKKLHRPVFITNDVRAATWGEWTHGAGRGCNNLVCLFIGTGIGGGIIINNKIVEGASNTAGELGHTIIDINGPKCSCGNYGCLETFAGGWGIAKRAEEAIEKHPTAGKKILQFANEKGITAKAVFQAYFAGDPLAKQLVDNITHALISGVISIVHAFNPERIILGGGIVSGMPELVEWIREGVMRSALHTATKKLQILPSELKENAGSIGAATFALQQVGIS